MGHAQGEAIFKPVGADTSNLRPAKLLYVTNACTNLKKKKSQQSCNVYDKRLLVFYTQSG